MTINIKINLSIALWIIRRLYLDYKLKNEKNSPRYLE